ncbi:MAG: hypothetical protein ACFFHV_13545 [Promethearchaeota archaeon]
MTADNFISVCPACGFSFRTFDPKTGRKLKNCPMCGYKLTDPDILPKNRNNFDNRIT